MMSSIIGKETIDGVEAFQLELIPKSEKAHNQFSQILLWIDGKTGVSVQQKLVQPSGRLPPRKVLEDCH